MVSSVLEVNNMESLEEAKGDGSALMQTAKWKISDEELKAVPIEVNQ